MTARGLHSIFARFLMILLALTSPIVRSALAYQVKADAALKLTGLRVEYKENPLGVDARKPRLSWQIWSGARGVMQSAYHIRVAASDRDLLANRNIVWDSGKVQSDES